jgi:hypothetical protein
MSDVSKCSLHDELLSCVQWYFLHLCAAARVERFSPKFEYALDSFRCVIGVASKVYYQLWFLFGAQVFTVIVKNLQEVERGERDRPQSEAIVFSIHCFFFNYDNLLISKLSPPAEYPACIWPYRRPSIFAPWACKSGKDLVSRMLVTCDCLL